MSNPASPLSVHDAAQRLGLEPVVLRALIHAKHVPAFRDNQGRWRVRIDADVTDAVAKAPAADRTPSPVVLSEEISELTASLNDQRVLVQQLQSLLRRQEALVDGFESVARSALAERDQARQEAGALDASLRRSLTLLAQAIDRGEVLSERHVALEGKLGRAVALLERSVSGQERMVGAADQAASGFERSLDLLENTAQNAQAGDAQATVEQLESQLNRALALLESTVGAGDISAENDGLPTRSRGRRGLLTRLRRHLGTRR